MENTEQSSREITDEERQEFLAEMVRLRLAEADTYLPGGPHLVSVTAAGGVSLVDESGRRYLDFGLGGAVSIMGHGYSTLVFLLSEHLRRYIYPGPVTDVVGLYQLSYAKKLLTHLDSDTRTDPRQVLVVSGVTEARRVATHIGTHPVSGQGPVVIRPISRTGERIEGGLLQDIVHRAAAAGKVIVADETVTGFGRTGRFLGIDHYGFSPEVVMLGPAGGGGLPFAAVVAPKELFDRLVERDIMDATPLVCAAASTVLDGLNDITMTNAVARGDYLSARLKEVVAQFPYTVVGHHGVGLLQHLQTADKGIEKQVIRGCRDRGLLLGPDLTLTPPLIVSEQEIDAAIDILADALIDVGGEP